MECRHKFLLLLQSRPGRAPKAPARWSLVWLISCERLLLCVATPRGDAIAPGGSQAVLRGAQIALRDSQIVPRAVNMTRRFHRRRRSNRASLASVASATIASNIFMGNLLYWVPLGAGRGGKLTCVSDRLPLYVIRSVYAKHIQRRILGLVLSLSSRTDCQLSASSILRFYPISDSLMSQKQGIEPQAYSRRQTRWRGLFIDYIREVARPLSIAHG